MSAMTIGLAFLLWLQNPADLFQKAPPVVDEALRARVKQFFQAHVDGKFRAAAEVVAEDSQDAFFAANKPRCYSFEIANIEYSDNFTRATAVVACEIDHRSPVTGRTRVKAPLTSLWKLEAGRWRYYIDTSAGQGQVSGNKSPGPGQGTAPPPAVSAPPAGAEAHIAALRSAVKASKMRVQLSRSKPGSDEVIFTNGLPVAATLVLQYSPMPGLEIALDRTELKPGEAACMTIKWAPKDHAPPEGLTAQVMARPTFQVISVRILFGS